MAEYRKVDEGIRRRLEAVVGAKNVSTTGEDIEKASVDESPLEPHPPEIVVKPANTAEVSAVMRLAYEETIPVVAQGGRTGLSGASHPVRGGIALSLERMNKILEIDEDNLTCTSEPAALISEVHAATEAVGLYYPPDPGQESGSIGGNINTNAGGMRAAKYGVTRDYVQALEVVLPTGEVVNMGGKNVKDTTGYSLIDLMIGSEGTLGVVTRATLRLVPKPKFTALIYAPFNSARDAAKTVAEIVKRKVQPYALEYLPQHAILTIEKYVERKLPDDTHPAYLMVGLEANSEAELDRILEEAGAVCMELGAVDAFLAETAEQQKNIWDARKKLFDAYLALYELDEADVCVPRAAVPAFVEECERVAKRRGVIIAAVGHAGDGNIHCNILRQGQSDEEWPVVLEATIGELIDISISMGGTVSGEHGLGYTKRRYLERRVGRTQVEIMKAIKRAFDPRNILNPDKVWL
ncbi:MAG: FAD-linked oxidase C-terminal domain-containing protein [Candidatus Bathyarchaeia archaeon]